MKKLGLLAPSGKDPFIINGGGLTGRCCCCCGIGILSGSALLVVVFEDIGDGVVDEKFVAILVV